VIEPFEESSPAGVEGLLNAADEENCENQQPREADQDLADFRVLYESSWYPHLVRPGG
jgi:hypothetical protein